MERSEDITDWADRIEHAIAGIERCCVNKAFVYQKTASTQDAAFRHRSPGGVCVIASVQTEGRGSRGRKWDDGEALTLPISFAIETTLDDVGLAARVGLAALDACADRAPDADVRIKWPNDVFVRAGGTDRKLAGVLVEKRDGVAIIGIGINARDGEPITTHGGVAFESLGAEIDRCELAIGLIERLTAWLSASDDQVRSQWAERDAMVGCDWSFELAGEIVRGEVTAIDPLTSISVRTETGDRDLPVATTRTA